jgi:hypothetical protein
MSTAAGGCNMVHVPLTADQNLEFERHPFCGTLAP